MNIPIVAYDISWPDQFRALKDELSALLPIEGPSVEHIGSTAVPGLAAKPVIDVLVGVADDAELNALPGSFRGRPGWYYLPCFEADMPFRRFFVKMDPETRPEDVPSVIEGKEWKRLPYQGRRGHLHAVVREHPFYAGHLKFRDLLRTDEGLRKRYERLKIELAGREWESGADYAEAKSDFIRAALGE